jgi:hypothetical protein
LLRAAARLVGQGGRPTLAQVAEEASVSRETAGLYFAGIEPLLVEATLDAAFHDAAARLEGDGEDPADRLIAAEAALAAMTRAQEDALRIMLSDSLRQGRRDERGPPVVRQNRRTALIEATLAPSHEDFDPEALRLLTNALALVFGTESLIVFEDVLQLGDADARRVKAWMIRTLVEGALRKTCRPRVGAFEDGWAARQSKGPWLGWC